MRFEEKEAKYILTYDKNDIGSIKNALKRYLEIISSGKGFEDDYCIVFFQPTGTIGKDYFEDNHKLLNYLTNYSYYYNEHSDSEHLENAITTEALFFMCAAKYNEMESDLKEAATIISNYSRALNDSSEMWLTCERPFGIDPMLIIATIYPECGYLLASYLVSNWDDEHMPEPLEALNNWVKDIGITEDSIKAYCYCDNARARHSMLGYDLCDGHYDIESYFNLYDYVHENPDRFEVLAKALSDRINDRPIIGADLSYEFCDDPIMERLTEIKYLGQPTDFSCVSLADYLERPYVEENAYEVKKRLEIVMDKEIKNKKWRLDVYGQEPAATENNSSYSSDDNPFNKEVLETMVSSNTAFDQRGYGKIMSNLDHSIKHVQYYLESFMRYNGLKVSKKGFALFDLTDDQAIEKLKKFGAGLLAVDTLEECHQYYEENWGRKSIFIRKESTGMIPIYNEEVIDYMYTCLCNDIAPKVTGVDIIIIDKLPEDIKVLLKCGVIYQNFYALGVSSERNIERSIFKMSDTGRCK